MTILTDTNLQSIADKVQNNERLTIEDGLYLFETPDLLGVGQLANQVNQKKEWG